MKITKPNIFIYFINLVLISTFSVSVNAASYTVDLAGTGDYTSIIDALDDPAVVNGDVINVNAGTYNLPYRKPINFNGKNVNVQSVSGPELTIIKPFLSSGVVFTSGETSAAILDGFTITGGKGTAVYNATGTLQGVFGGGILINGAYPTIKNSIITSNGNTDSIKGGGIAIFETLGEEVTISDSTISYNKAYTSGGGIYVRAWFGLPVKLAMTNCTVTNNTTSGYQTGGGGIFSTSYGGLYAPPPGVTITLTNCMINSNAAGGTIGTGGAIFVQDTNVILKNSTVANNRGSVNSGQGGLLIDNGYSSGFYLTVTNSIIWDNYPNYVAQISGKNLSEGTVDYSDVGPEGWLYSGTNNINIDPLFVDPANVDTSLRDHHLGRCSPAIDAGTNTGAPFYDIDGDIRPIGLTVDMGADESWEDSSVVCLAPSGPTADAGPDQTVNEDETVVLGGNGSVGDTLLWEQIAGTAVTLDDPSSANPGFVAPLITGGLSSEVLTFQLTAENDDGSQDQATVNITVVNINTLPVADAGDDLWVNEGSIVTLSGSNSYDTDGDTLSYLWTQISGPVVALIPDNAESPQFTAPLLDGGSSGESLILEFQLDIFDGFDHAYDTVVVTVEQVNHEPSASAGQDQTVSNGDVVVLDGLGSSDPDSDPLFYEWTQTGGPAVTLSDIESVDPSFEAPFVNETSALTFQLVVSDGLADSLPDEVVITVLSPNAPPQCQLAVAEPSSLWPPNHKMTEVSISGVTDVDNANATIVILGVTQDEPVDGLGDGDTGPDAVIQDDTVLIRAERSGLGDGRVYTISYSATDESGASCTGTVNVQVLHERKKGAIAIDSGQDFDATVH